MLQTRENTDALRDRIQQKEERIQQLEDNSPAEASSKRKSRTSPTKSAPPKPIKNADSAYSIRHRSPNGYSGRFLAFLSRRSNPTRDCQANRVRPWRLSPETPPSAAVAEAAASQQLSDEIASRPVAGPYSS